MRDAIALVKVLAWLGVLAFGGYALAVRGHPVWAFVVMVLGVMAIQVTETKHDPL